MSSAAAGRKLIGNGSESPSPSPMLPLAAAVDSVVMESSVREERWRMVLEAEGANAWTPTLDEKDAVELERSTRPRTNHKEDNPNRFFAITCLFLPIDIADCSIERNSKKEATGQYKSIKIYGADGWMIGGQKQQPLGHVVKACRDHKKMMVIAESISDSTILRIIIIFEKKISQKTGLKNPPKRCEIFHLSFVRRDSRSAQRFFFEATHISYSYELLGRFFLSFMSVSPLPADLEY